MQSGTVVTPRDVPALVMDLPPEPRSWDTDDQALIAAVTEAKGRAYIGLKSAESARVSATARVEPQEAWRPDVMVRKGTRAALSADEVRLGLRMLEERGVRGLGYLDAIGVAYVEIEPDSAPVIRAMPMVDYLEPALAVYSTNAIAARPSAAASRLAKMFTQVVPWGIDSVRAPQAWSVSTGVGAKLLIVDTGHEQAHEDLPTVLGNHCFGSEGGCDDGAPYPHGTLVAGVAMARDNSVGVVGVAPEMAGSDVYYWGVCTNYLVCVDSLIPVAVNWSVTGLSAPGVINLSLGSTQFSQTLANAIAAAISAGHVIVAAAGNNLSNTLIYPAAYSGVIGVSGLNSNLSFAASGTTACGGYSNYGTHVDLSAPFDVYTTVPTGTYGNGCGTSFSSPHVAGVALLMRSAHPSWSNSDVASQLLITARDLGSPGFDSYTGKGIVRADLAVGLYRPTIAATVDNGHPKLSWDAIPLANKYRIYRRVSGTTQPPWSLWTTVNAPSTTYTDGSTQVTSFYGYSTIPGTDPAVSYYVTAVTAGGYESGYIWFATYRPDGIPPE
jgi:subtilisin